MAHQAVKPYSFLMYILAIIAFFFLGLMYAGMIDAGKGQMLAGGAIVFGYGVLGAFIGLILSLILAFKSSRSVILKLNIVLALVIIALFAYFRMKYQQRQEEKLKHELPKKEQPTKPTSHISDVGISQPIAMHFGSPRARQVEPIMGLGMFTPNLHRNKPFYFYGDLTLGKSVQVYIFIDSITFRQREYGGFDIATAPPWLVPDHLKLDYDMLYFKITSVGHDFIEVVVNITNNQTAYVDRYAGTLSYWPDFLLQVNSVEFIDPTTQKVYARSFKKSGVVTTTFSVMKPKKIAHHWMLVELLNDNFEIVGKGWIQWKNEEKLLIRYSLLS